MRSKRSMAEALLNPLKVEINGHANVVRRRGHLIRSVFAAILPPLLAFGTQSVLWNFIAPFVWYLFYPTVFISSWVGGFYSGVASTFISTALVWYYFLPEVTSVSQEASRILSMGTFLTMGIVFSMFHGRLRRANQEANTALEKAEQARLADIKFHTLAEAVPQIVWITTPNGENIYFNQKWVDYTGLTMEESSGGGWNKPFHPDDQQQAWDAWQKAVKTDGVYSLECRLRRKDGTYHWWLIRGESLHDKDGKIINWFGTCTDVEDIKQAEAALKQARDDSEATNQKLQKANEEIRVLYEKSSELSKFKSQMFANVSHELRTPLTLILGPIESLLSTDLPVDVREGLQLVQRNARGLLKQVNDLLDVARIEAGKNVVNYSDTDLAKLIRHIASGFDFTVKAKGLKFSVVTPPSMPVQMDAEKIERILVNLLSNAVKFTPAGGTIRCQLHVKPGNLSVIEVADSGPGVPKTYRESIFAPFFQVPGIKRFEGTGLGLSIVKEFAEIQHGQVRVSGAPEGGALFTIEIPAAPPEGTTVTQHSDFSASARAPIPSFRTHKWEQVRFASSAFGIAVSASREPLVLVVEDNPDMREYICETLGPNIAIVTAENGHEGLEKARTLKPDLIISDIMMPEMTGEQMFREIRSNPELESIPFILLTARADEELRIELLREGAIDYIIKPFMPEELKSKARNFLAVKAAEAKYRGLMESAQDAIVVVGTDGKIKFANHQTTSWFGYTKAELIGQPIGLLIPERFRALHVSLQNDYLLAPKPRQMAERKADLCARRKDGGEFPVSIALSHLRTPEGLLVTSIIRDISEVKKLSAQAIAAREEAIAVVSHDLRNPISSIHLATQLLKRSSPDQREHTFEKTIVTVENALRNMNNLIQDLLDFAKIEAKRFTVDIKSEDISSMLTEVFGIFEPLAQAKSISLKREIRAGASTVFCERGLIIRVLSNLIANAIKFTPNGGLVAVLVESTDGHIQFTIRDTGPGIEPALLPLVFERYWQAPETAKKGTGLGLAIARGFVEAHNGRIWVESKLGAGSVFFFTLPRSLELKNISPLDHSRQSGGPT